MSQQVIEIDGATMEGGGQILRMSMAFSALLQKPIKVYNIRAGRSTPGLRPQHLSGLKLVRDITNGKLIGAEQGSTEVTFYPGKIASGQFSADPGTAGSIMLLFQVAFPCLLFADGPAELYLKGGTNAEMAPQIDHTLMVFKPTIEEIGARFDCNIKRRGYYPKGGGEVIIKTFPVSGSLKPIEILERGDVNQISGRSFTAGVLPIKMANSMAGSATRCLKKAFPKLPVDIQSIKEPSHAAFGNGSGIVIVATTDKKCLFGGSALGKRGLQAEEVGNSAAQSLIEDIATGGCVDRHVQDQLIIFMALANGTSKIKVGPPTLHTKTAIFIAELLTKAKFTIHTETQQSCVIECQGIGLQTS